MMSAMSPKYEYAYRNWNAKVESTDKFHIQWNMQSEMAY